MFHHIKKKYVRVYVNTVFIYTIACFWWLCYVNIAYSVQIFKETSVRCSHKFSLYIRFHYKLNTTVSLVKKTQNVRAYAWSHRINKVNRLNVSHLFKVNFFFASTTSYFCYRLVNMSVNVFLLGNIWKFSFGKESSWKVFYSIKLVIFRFHLVITILIDELKN